MTNDRIVRASQRTSAWLAARLASASLAAAPPAGDVAPPGVWTPLEVDGAPTPWPGATVQIGVADDGVTLLVDTGCERYLAVAKRDRGGVTLERGPGSDVSCEGSRAAAEATVNPVLDEVDEIAVAAGAPRVASADRLNPSRFARAVEASAANGAHWVRDPVRVAPLPVDEASSERTVIVRDELPAAEATIVRFWCDRLRDDATRARWYEVLLERTAGGTWHVASAPRAALCGRGNVTDELVAGFCP